jgi:hypothetical protein
MIPTVFKDLKVRTIEASIANGRNDLYRNKCRLGGSSSIPMTQRKQMERVSGPTLSFIPSAVRSSSGKKQQGCGHLETG